MSFSVTSFVMYKIKKLKSFIREEKVFRKKKTKSFLKPFCYGYGSGNVTEFLSFVTPGLSPLKSSLSFSQEWDLPTQERRKKKNAPT